MPAPQQAALEFRNIRKHYRQWFRPPVRALDDFSLSVQRGEIFGFLGPNGAGKTTAIHLALGFMRPTSGDGSLLGHPLGDAPTRRRVGFLAENVAFAPLRTEPLVRFYGTLNGMRDPELRERTRALLAEVGLEQARERPARELSRGMLQRAGLAQALVNDPELVVLDEPTSALDPVARVRVREMLLRAREQGKTIFLSSHLLSEVEMICDRIAILQRGRVARLGTIEQLLGSGAGFVISARGINAEKFGGRQQGGAIVIEVEAATQRPTVERIWASGGEVTSIVPRQRTLEQLFLELATESSSQTSDSHSHGDDEEHGRQS